MEISNDTKSTTSCVPNLRLTDRQFQELIVELDNRTSLSDRNNGKERAHKRVQYRKQVKLVIDVEHPGGSVARFAVRSRNISTGGMGLLHGGFIYANSFCSTMLPRLDGQWVRIPSRVAWAKPVKGTIHEVGLQFEEKINIADFVDKSELLDLL